MIERFLPLSGRIYENPQVSLGLLLADILAKGAGTE